MPFPNEIITCRALAHIFEQLLNSNDSLTVLVTPTTESTEPGSHG